MIVMVEDDQGEVIARICTDDKDSHFEIVKKGYHVSKYTDVMPGLKYANHKLQRIEGRTFPLGGCNAGRVSEGVCQGACNEQSTGKDI